MPTLAAVPTRGLDVQETLGIGKGKLQKPPGEGLRPEWEHESRPAAFISPANTNSEKRHEGESLQSEPNAPTETVVVKRPLTEEKISNYPDFAKKSTVIRSLS